MNHLFHKLIDVKYSKWPAIIWSAFIFVLLLMPMNRFPEKGWISIPHLDKIIHLFLFAVFAFLWNAYLKNKKRFENKSYRVMLIILLIAAYGLLLEYLQQFAGRSFDMYDLLADIGGGVLLMVMNIRRK